MRTALVAAVGCYVLLGTTATAQVHASIRKHTDIPQQKLDDALRALASSRGVQLIYLSDDVGTRLTEGAVGELTLDEALKKLLSGSGLIYEYVDSSTVAIYPSAARTTSSTAGDENAVRATAAESGSSMGSRFQLADLQNESKAALTPSGGSSAAPDSSAASVELEQVVVTAQKREERLQDVPVPVSVVNTAELATANQSSLRDYYMSVPGLSLSPNIVGTQTISIRGLTTGGYETPAVGVTIDDVPFAGNQVPEIDPGDLARIEVLRGPQGTLYGSNSMGGLLKYVTAQPSTTGYGGSFEAGSNVVYNGANAGVNVRGALNVPLDSSAALRVSAFEREDPGFIDNPGNCAGTACAATNGINRTEARGGRVAFLWEPIDHLAITLNALYQNTSANGSSEVDKGAGLNYLQQDYIAGVGGYDRRIQAYSSVVDYKISGVDLKSVTGYNVYAYTDTTDYTSFYGDVQSYGVAGAYLYTHFVGKRLTQELRASGTFASRLDWLAGFYFTHAYSTENDNFQTVVASDPTTGNSAALIGVLGEPSNSQQIATFGDITYHVTDRFDVQVGGREDWIKTYTPETTYTGLFASVTPGFGSSDKAFTYLFTPRFVLSPDAMVYARLASGYRPGGPNTPYTVSLGAPAEQKADKTYTYEIGAKAGFGDGLVSLDASLYYIDWKNIQLQLQEGNFVYGGNGSSASSDGVEVTATYRPLTHTSISGWVDYDDAVLTQSLPAASTVYGAKGDRLPNTSRWSGTLSLQQELPINNSVSGFFSGQVSYVGNRLGILQDYTDSGAPRARQYLPGFAKTDVRAGFKWDTWTSTLYVNNLANVRGLLNGGIGYTLPFAYVYIPPRTIGISVSKTF